MLSVTNLKSGTIFEDQGQLFKVVSYEHIKVGRGSANIRVKVKNVRTGATFEKSFINGAKVNEITIANKELQFLYKDPDNAFFMDPLTFEQVSVPISVMDDYIYLKEGQNFSVSFLSFSIKLTAKNGIFSCRNCAGCKRQFGHKCF
jgi:elongation factor P